MFFTTKLTRTTAFALLNQRYYNLWYQTIYQKCVFQGYSWRSPCYDIVAGIPYYICLVYLFNVVFFLGTAMTTKGQKQEIHECWVAINKSLGCILTGNCTFMAGYFNFNKSLPAIKGIFRTHAKSKVEFFVALVNGWMLLTKSTKSSIF